MSKDIRVLLVDLSKSFGGASVRALTLAKHLKPWDIAIAGLEDSPVVTTAKQWNIPVKIVGKSRMDPLIPWRLMKVIREDHIQLIDTQNIQSKFWGCITALLIDVGFVSTLNSSYENEQGKAWKGRFYSLLDRWTNFNTHRHIVVSKAIEKELLQAGIPASRIDLITNAVEVEDSSQTDDPQLTRKRFGIPVNAILCVSVGRLVWAKGYEDFIDAFVSVTKQVPNAYALIIGGGGLYSSLSERIRKAGLEKRLKLLDQCSERVKRSVLKASDIFVMSSRSEGVPFAILEAAALGLPILSTSCGGIPDILVDTVEALLVPAGNPRALSTALIRLCEDRDLAQRLGASAKEKIEREFSLSKQVEAIRQAYSKALAPRLGRG